MMDSETFLIAWAFIATCGIGIFHAKATSYRKKARSITFLLCEVVSGDVKPKFDEKTKTYTIESEDILFKFGRRDDK